MKREGLRHYLIHLGYSTIAGLFFGFFIGYLTGHYRETFLHALAIAYAIWIFNTLLKIFFIPRIQTLPRVRRLWMEIWGYFLASLLGFFLPIFIFYWIFRFDFYLSRVIIANVALLIVLYIVVQGSQMGFRFYRELKEKETSEARLKALAAQSEFRALRAQMNPHFLFNTLNAINALITDNPGLARRMLGQMADLLRMGMEGQDSKLGSLGKELEFARKYMEIEKIRFGKRMHYTEDIDHDLENFDFPVMVLQPLLENAVRHGIALSRGKGLVHLSLKRSEHWIHCVISNTMGSPTSRKRIVNEKSGEDQNGIGIRNITERLDLLYEGQYEFFTGISGENQFQVELKIPWNAHEVHESSDHR